MKLIKSKSSLFFAVLLISILAMFQLPSYAADNKIKISFTKIKAKTFLGVHDSVQDMSKISEIIGKAYHEIGEFMKKNQIEEAGAPMTITISMAGSKWDFVSAIPIEKKDIKTEGRIMLSTIKAGKVVKGIMTGPYEKSKPCYDAIVKFIRKKNLKITGFSWEEYISDPGDTKPENLITNIYFPVE